MHIRATVAGIVLATAALAGCSNHRTYHTSFPDAVPPTAATPVTSAPLPKSKLATSPRTTACWQAIRGQYTPGTVQLTGAPTEPPACQGLTADEVSAIASDVLSHQLGG